MSVVAASVEHSTVAVNVLDAQSLLSSFGTIGVFVILVMETGLLIGLFLPGDSLLFTAGVLSATSSSARLHLNLGWVLVAAVSGALIGAEIGYLLGRGAGGRMLNRPDQSRIVSATNRTGELVQRYGVRKTIVLARFIPLVRTVANPMMGAIGVPFRTFTTWQVLGGILWSAGIVLLGWQVGSRIHNVDHYLLPIVAMIVALSVIPVVLEIRRERNRRVAVES